MKNFPSKLRCRAVVYLPCHTLPTRCVGWRKHFGDHLCRAKGGILVGKHEAADVPIEITWPNTTKRGKA